MRASWMSPSTAFPTNAVTSTRPAKAIQDKLDRLDEAFVFERSIDIETYDRLQPTQPY